MWIRGYTNQNSSNTTTSPADNNNVCGAIDQYGNPMNMMMSLPADDSLNGRRLRPLIPKLSTFTSIPTIPTCLTQYESCDTTNNDFFPLNHHMNMTQSHPQFIGVTEQGGRGQFNGHQSVMVSSRWNPTPEQLRTLEELYRCGTRTPSAVQIQHITGQLRRYGKIEGKNVFYWFQNHKARERQKRRRHQLGDSSSSNDQQQSQDHQTKEPAIGKTTILSSEHVFNLSGDDGNHNENMGRKTGFEMEQTGLWVAPQNCSTLADQESVHKLEKTAAECVTDYEWVHLQDNETSLQNASTIMLQYNAEEHKRRRTSVSLFAKNSTWDNTHYSSTNPCIKHTTTVNEVCEYPDGQNSNKQAAGALTLELFPLRSNGETGLIKDDDDDNGEKGTHLTSYQFFEFLPLKNSAAY